MAGRLVLRFRSFTQRELGTNRRCATDKSARALNAVRKIRLDIGEMAQLARNKIFQMQRQFFVSNLTLNCSADRKRTAEKYAEKQNFAGLWELLH